MRMNEHKPKTSLPYAMSRQFVSTTNRGTSVQSSSSKGKHGTINDKFRVKSSDFPEIAF